MCISSRLRSSLGEGEEFCTPEAAGVGASGATRSKMSPEESERATSERVAPIRLFEASADDPKPPLRAAPIAVQYNGADWVVSLVQAMVYLPPLVPVIRDAAIGDSLSPVWSAFVSLARRVRTRSLGALPLAGLVESLASAFEALLSDLGSGARRSPESALDLLTVPAGSVFSSAFGADVQRRGSPFVAAREGGVPSIVLTVVAGTTLGLEAAVAAAFGSQDLMTPPAVLCVRFDRGLNSSLVVASFLGNGVLVGGTEYTVASGVLSNTGGYSSFVNPSGSDGEAVWLLKNGHSCAELASNVVGVNNVVMLFLVRRNSGTFGTADVGLVLPVVKRARPPKYIRGSNTAQTAYIEARVALILSRGAGNVVGTNVPDANGHFSRYSDRDLLYDLQHKYLAPSPRSGSYVSTRSLVPRPNVSGTSGSGGLPPRDSQGPRTAASMRLCDNRKAKPSRGEGRKRTGGRAATAAQTRC